MELGLVYVLPDARGHGAATQLISSALSAARAEWPKVETCYASVPSASEPVERLLRAADAEIMSGSTAWQKRG